ncbi:MAG: hypothetical protein HC869_10840, partial [Rhodospirillales bacterium]|nr:hypothetical protein [Rhodospirillales bacterium]
MSAPFGQFKRVVRGYDPGHGGFQESPYALTVDGGCGFDGQLMAACLNVEGEILEVVDLELVGGFCRDGEHAHRDEESRRAPSTRGGSGAGRGRGGRRIPQQPH